ncbi:MAG: ATP-binding protein, partial [Cyanobacteria bacterium P01_H01_bin.153]
YAQDLLKLIETYQSHHAALPLTSVEEIEQLTQAIDLAFLQQDFPQVLDSIKHGADRINTIVKSLRTFSRLDEADWKDIDIHESLDSTLVVLQHRLHKCSNRPAIAIVKDYGNLPRVECFAGQINEVFMHLLNNAIDALDEAASAQPEISLWTRSSSDDTVAITISDNGPGIPQAVRDRIFDPFFTTKPVGMGTGMGLSTSYQIITETHEGNLWYVPVADGGSQFLIELPIRLSQEMKRPRIKQNTVPVA